MFFFLIVDVRTMLHPGFYLRNWDDPLYISMFKEDGREEITGSGALGGRFGGWMTGYMLVSVVRSRSSSDEKKGVQTDARRKRKGGG